MTQVYTSPVATDKLTPDPLEDYGGPTLLTRPEEIRRAERAIHLLRPLKNREGGKETLFLG